MNQSFYIGAVGAQQQLYHLNVHGDNIANVNTYGYKANKSYFSALMYQNWPGVEAELPKGVGTRMLMTHTDYSQGSPSETGRAMDFYIEGNGFFALVDLATGEVTFTRNGAFMMSQLEEPTGEVDENGDPVLDEDGNPVTERVFYLGDNEGRLVLSDRGGLIRIDDPNAELPVGIFDYINYDGMVQLDDTRYLPVDKNGNLWYGDGKLIRGYLELSNADLADEITKVIEAQRAYTAALKMVITSDEIENTINNLRT